MSASADQYNQDIKTGVRPGWGAWVISLVWLVLFAVYVFSFMGLEELLSLLPHEFASLISAALVPIVLILVGAAALTRAQRDRAIRDAMEAGGQLSATSDLELEGRVAELTAGLQRVSQQVESDMGAALQRAEGLQAQLQQQAGGLSNLAAQTAQQSEQVEGAVQQRLAEIDKLLQQLNSSANEISAVADQQTGLLENAGINAAARAVEFNQMVSEATEALTASLSSARDQASELGNSVKMPTEILQAAADHMSGQAAVLTGDIQKQCEQLQSLLASVTKTATDAGGAVEKANVALRRNVAATLKESDGLVERTANQVSDLEKAMKSAGTVADGLDKAVQQRAGEFARMADELKVAAGDAEQAVVTATGTLQAEGQQIAGTVDGLSERLELLDGRSEEVLDGAGAAISRIEDVQTELSGVAGALDEARESARARAEEVSAFMEDTANRADKRLSQVVRRAEEAVNISSEHINGIAARLAEIGRTAEAESLRMATQARDLAEQGRKVGDVIATRAAEFSLLTNDVENAARNALQSIGESEGIARNIAAAMNNVAGDMETATHRMGEGADEATGRINAARDNAELVMANLREQAVDMVAVLEHHAETLSQTGQQVAGAADVADGQMREQLAQVTANVTRAIAEAKAAVTEVERAGVVMAEATELSQRTMTESVEVLDTRSGEVVDRVAERTGQLAERTAEIGLLLQDLENAAGGSLRAMSGLTGETRKLVASLGEGTNLVTDAAEQLSVNAGRGASDLQQMGERISGTAGEISTRFITLQGVFESQAELLDGVVARLNVAADHSTAEVATRLNALADRVDGAQQTARELVESFDTGSAELLNRAGAAREQINLMAADIGARAEDAMVEANAAGEKLAARIGEIGNMTADLRSAMGAAKTEFEDVSKSSGEAVNRLREGTEAMETAIAGVENRLSRAVMMVRGENSALAENSTLVVGQMEAGAAQVAEQGAQLLALSEDVRLLSDTTDEALSARLQASAENLQTVAEQSRALVGEIRQASDELRNAGSATEGQMAALVTHFERSVATLGETAAATADDIRIASGDVERENVALRDVAQDVGAKLALSASHMEDVVGRVSDHVDKAEVRLQSLATLMQGASDQVRSTSTESAENVRRVQEQMQVAVRHTSDAQRETENLMNSTDRARLMVEESVGEMSGTLNRFGGVTESMAGKTAELVEQANAGAARLTREFQDATAELRKFGLDEEATMDRLRAVTADLDMRVGSFVERAEQMEATGDAIAQQLDARLQTLNSAENAAIRVTAELGSTLEKAISSLSDLADKGDLSRDELIQKLRDTHAEFEALNGRVDAHLNSLQDGIGQARENAAEAVDTMRNVRDELRSGATQFEQAAAKLSESAAHQREAYQSVLEEGRVTTKTAAEHLALQASAIASASQAATVQSGLAARAFEGQADKLIKASEQAARAAVSMREVSAADREASFIDNAGQVMSGLNELSVEVASQLDQRRDERMWRQFLKGEGGIFARHVVASSDRRQIADRYKSDEDFRRAVKEYLAEFESMVKRIDGTEKQSALTAALVTADVGKLYLALCDALDRKPLRVYPFA